MEAAAWLQDLGLEPYVPAFPDERVLPSLTAEDWAGDWKESRRRPGRASTAVARPTDSYIGLCR
jgi:hypothetical protein